LSMMSSRMCVLCRYHATRAGALPLSDLSWHSPDFAPLNPGYDGYGERGRVMVQRNPVRA
jgi:hypothetical protein